MKKKYLVSIVVLLFGLIAIGAWADCLDETNPECWQCKSIGFLGKYCSLVVGGDTGYCSCTTKSLGTGVLCLPEGQFCGMIIVVG